MIGSDGAALGGRGRGNAAPLLGLQFGRSTGTRGSSLEKEGGADPFVWWIKGDASNVCEDSLRYRAARSRTVRYQAIVGTNVVMRRGREVSGYQQILPIAVPYPQLRPLKTEPELMDEPSPLN